MTNKRKQEETRPSEFEKASKLTKSEDSLLEQTSVASSSNLPSSSSSGVSFDDSNNIVNQQEQQTFSSPATTNNTPPSSSLSPTTTLDPTLFKKWTKEEVCSLLCTDEGKGGAGLTETKVQPLYDAGFDGNSLANIISTIKEDGKKEAIGQLKSTYKEAGISLTVELTTTLQTVVNWVDNLLKTRLYHLWDDTEIKNQLCKAIGRCGAGLNERQYRDIIQPKLNESPITVVITEVLQDNNCTIRSLIDNWLKSIQLETSVIFSDKKFIDDLLKLARKEENIEEAVEKIYDGQYAKLCEKNITPPTITELLTLKPSHNPIPIDYKWNEKVPRIEAPNVKLPISISSTVYFFNKYQLPFIPSLQKETELDKQVTVSNGECYLLISPSGIGKTGLMIRTLSKIPGILITGTARTDMGSGNTTDSSVKIIMEHLGSNGVAFATVRQLCHLLLISKLLHILHLLNLADTTSTLLEPFEGNLHAFLAFNQSNGNTTASTEILDSLLLSQYKWCEINELRSLTRQLIVRVKEKLYPNSTESCKKFIICVDEANVLEEHGPKFISCRGSVRGFLSVLTYEIENLKHEITSSIYGGTSISVNVSKVVQSVLMKTEVTPKIFTLTNFPKFEKKEFLEYIESHIILDAETRECIANYPNSFPIRIRQAAFFLELYITKQLINLKPFSSAFEESFKKATEQIQESIAKYLKKSKDHEETYFRSIKDSLFNYIMHFRFPCLFGYTFHEYDKELAATILGSGLTNATDSSMTTFEANDALGYRVATSLVSGLKQDATIMDLANNWLKYTKSRVAVEKIVAMGLLNIGASTTELHELFKIEKSFSAGAKFQCECCLNDAGYLKYCSEKGQNNISNYSSGECLYIQNIIDGKWDLLYGVAFLPSPDAHPDIILFNKGVDNKPFLLTFSIKVLVGKDLEQDVGFKSTIPHLMYINNYKTITLENIGKLNGSISGDKLCKFVSEKLKEAEEDKKLKKGLFYNTKPEAELWKSNLSTILDAFGDRWISVVIHMHKSKEFNRTNAYPLNVSWLDRESVYQLFPDLKENFEVFFGHLKSEIDH